jgi:hypothetical protein
LSANIAGHSGGGATTADDDDDDGDDDGDDAVIAVVSREEPPPAGARYSTPSDEDRPEAPGTSIIPSRAVDHRWSLWSSPRDIANDDDVRRRPMRTSAAAALPPGWPESSGEEEDPATMPPVVEVQAAVAFADPARRWGRMVIAITMERGRVGILLFRIAGVWIILFLQEFILVSDAPILDKYFILSLYRGNEYSLR